MGETEFESDRESFGSDGEFKRVSWIIWFRSELRSEFANILIQIGTSEHIWQNIWFRSVLQDSYLHQTNLASFYVQ